MRILLCAPGPLHSTRDCYEYYREAMQQEYDVELSVFSYHNLLKYHYAAVRNLTPDILEHDAQQIAMARASRELLTDIALKAPDFVFFVAGMGMPLDTYRHVLDLRQRLSHQFATVMYLTESPYLDVDQQYYAKYADVLFVNDKYSVKTFDPDEDHYVFYLPHSYNPSVHYPRMGELNEHYKSEVLFCGTPFKERVDLIDSVEWKSLEVDLKLIGRWSNYLSENNCEHLRPYIVDVELMPNVELAEYYRNTKIALNIHRTRGDLDGDGNPLNNYTDAYSIGPRIYEAAACEAFILSDYRQELVDLLGDTVDIYSDGYELMEKIDFWLHPEHELLRIEKAKAARDKIRSCTFYNRFTDIILPPLREVMEAYIED